MILRMNWLRHNTGFRFTPVPLTLCLLFLSIWIYPGCSVSREQPVVVWTNQQDFISYAELFNAVQDNTKVIVIYKQRPAESLPAAKDETPPDIVIGPWLQSEKLRKNFKSLNYLFSEQQINSAAFYPQLLEAGAVKNKQYLLPVSFNLPAVIFSKENEGLISENYILSLDQIRDTAAMFNKQNKSGIYTNMGFAPRWNPDFLYTAAKIKNCKFNENENIFSWDPQKLSETADYLKQWTLSVNSSTSAENDFAFKYLYTPGYKQVTSGACLFSYTTSDELFNLPADRLQNIDYRWIHDNNNIYVEDDIVFLGLYKKAQNSDGAEQFITWLMKEDTQRQLLERTKSMGLSTATFGISGGFSAIKNVTERIFPAYYQTLLDNLPAADYLAPPDALPPRWESLKTRVVIPWLEQATDTEKNTPPVTMETLISEWTKQFN